MSQHALWHTIVVDTLMNLDAQLFAITLSAACTHTDILLKLLETIELVFGFVNTLLLQFLAELGDAIACFTLFH